MTFITRNGLKIFYRRTYMEKGVKSINESLERKNWSNFTGQLNIFLSHSHLDNDIIEQCVVFFDNLGVEAYVDWMDNKMPSITDTTTAKRIKQKIIENDKFILVASNNSVNSIWCNWELGFGDAHKFPKCIAVFPVTEDDGEWIGKEYLKIYPRIELERNNNIHEPRISVVVIFPNGTKIPFEKWIEFE